MVKPGEPGPKGLAPWTRMIWPAGASERRNEDWHNGNTVMAS